jgi:hypothetical protein
MRTLLFLLLAACGQSSGTPGAQDLAVAVTPDLANNFDLMPPATCSTVDPMLDGQPCPMTGCPANQIPVTTNGSCQCWQKCDPSAPTVCPCDRRCAELVRGDMGVVGGGCVPGNGPGERCGESGVSGDNALGCAQGMVCVNADPAGMNRYCVYDCTGNLSCPVQTSCLTLSSSTQMACAFDSITNGVAAGGACQPNDQCAIGLLCADGTCKPQCDRPGATCASGSCTALTDGTRTSGYVCK